MIKHIYVCVHEGHNVHERGTCVREILESKIEWVKLVERSKEECAECTTKTKSRSIKSIRKIASKNPR